MLILTPDLSCLDLPLHAPVQALMQHDWHFLGSCQTSHEAPTPEKTYLEKTFRFNNFLEAVAFVQALTPFAEKAGHHPDLMVGWGRVVVQLSTHDAGHRVTLKDVQLAQVIDTL
jgi:pterin-4a-carbinolamine dehydratase